MFDTGGGPAMSPRSSSPSFHKLQQKCSNTRLQLLITAVLVETAVDDDRDLIIIVYLKMSKCVLRIIN